MHPCSFDMICWFKQRYTLSLLVKQARQHTCFSACNIPAELDLISMLWKYIEVPSTNSAKWCVCADNNTGTCFPKTPRPNIFTKSQFDWEVLCERRRAWIRINFVSHGKLFKEPWKNEMTSRFADGCIRGRHFWSRSHFSFSPFHRTNLKTSRLPKHKHVQFSYVRLLPLHPRHMSYNNNNSDKIITLFVSTQGCWFTFHSYCRLNNMPYSIQHVGTEVYSCDIVIETALKVCPY